MRTLDLSQIKPIPGFDCVAMKREIQAKIYEETKGMTREEVRKYIRKGAERLDEERRLRQTELATQAQT